MEQLFASEEDAIKWVGLNIPWAVKPKKKAKTIFINPFSSRHAHDVVVQSLGKQLFKLQQKQHLIDMMKADEELGLYEQEVCNYCGKTLREQLKGCGEITCYRQYLRKQETLEEAADKYFPFADKMGGETYTAYRGFITGAKWQQEQNKKCYHPLPYRLAKSDFNFECTLCGKFI
jgi:hypothetical protein